MNYFGGDSAARLIRRARAINAELATVRGGAQVATLEGAFSATGLALAIVDYSALYTTPYAREYVGAGNPAEAL